MSQRPRIVFLIPIASPRRTKNWQLACSYFRQTLSSIFNSTSANYCVVVAGHEPPNFQLPQGPKFKFLSLDHPLPSQEGGYYLAAVKDKLRKLEAAWEYARSTWNPDYVMKLDWDDLVSSQLVDWLASAQDEAGYLIKHGWVWLSGSRFLIQRTEYFDRHCGSCLIIRSDLADRTGPFLTLVEGIALDEAGRRFAARDNYSLVPGSGVTTLLLNDSHQRYTAQFSHLGHRLATVPFKAAVCRIDHGNNAAAQTPSAETVRMFLGRIRRTRLITRRLKKEFMVG